ncbi:MAG: aminomethyl-transferring glycine dehydrogenase subunit GcvPA [Solirubrobacterales bacterium]|nr:aminomethyl-transferring glycine dehydrogenase subunit GcvPA [Solirubrobacterales bacterium]MCB8914772.1 aminomethyl-transferring glycine dehydrogenase subunit GcvPA [Thermoleophilales bacterium]
MAGYTPATDPERAEMLARIGVESIDELFAQIPADIRLDRPLDLEDGMSESEVYRFMAGLADTNLDAERIPSFLGAGMYDHYVPAIVEAIISRSEFLTPYTPYQPEVSQGGLQVMFEFQTAMSEITGLPVSNAGLYEGPSAAASAAYLAMGQTKRTGLVASRGLHPHSRETLATHAVGFGATLTEVGLEGGLTGPEDLEAAVTDETAAVFLQNPNFLGAVEDIAALGEAVKAKGALLIVQVDPMTLGILRPPGECGADIAYGEGQPLGNRLDFGGPSFGFFCAKEEYIRKMPGRIAGETEDVDGRRGFVLALQTREQHIRREKATSNICTAQALNALAGMVHLAWLGKQGFVELGELMARRTAYTRNLIGGLDGYELLHDAPVVREFAVRSERPVGEILPLGDELDGPAPRLPVYPLGRDYPEFEDSFLVAITENRSVDEIGWLAHMLEHGQAGWSEHIHEHDDEGNPVAGAAR